MSERVRERERPAQRATKDTYGDPRVLESLASSETLGEVERQEAVDEVLGALADATPVLGRVAVVARLSLDIHLLLVVTIERREATEAADKKVSESVSERVSE